MECPFLLFSVFSFYVQSGQILIIIKEPNESRHDDYYKFFLKKGPPHRKLFDTNVSSLFTISHLFLLIYFSRILISNEYANLNKKRGKSHSGLLTLLERENKKKILF